MILFLDGEKMIVANNDGVAMPTSNPPQLVDYPVSKPKPAPAGNIIHSYSHSPTLYKLACQRFVIALFV